MSEHMCVHTHHTSLCSCQVILCVMSEELCFHQVGSAARSTVLSSTGGKSLKDNIVNVFGSRLADGLVPVSAETAHGTRIVGWVVLSRFQFAFLVLPEDFRNICIQ